MPSNCGSAIRSPFFVFERQSSGTRTSTRKRGRMASSTSTERTDEVMMRLASMAGGIEPLLSAVFGFLQRRTDFYVVDPSPKRPIGFAPGDAEKLVLRCFRQFPMRDVSGRPQPHESPTKAPRAAEPPIVPPGAAVPLPVPSEPASRPARAEFGSPPPAVRRTAAGKQEPVGNGGVSRLFTWTQSLKDVTVSLPVPSCTKGKDVAVDFRPRSLRVALEGAAARAASDVLGGPSDGPLSLLEGELDLEVRPSECLWSIERDEAGVATVVIVLEKVLETWWEQVVVGGEEDRIDTQKIDSTKPLDEFDGDTQSAIRKMMFEQQQQQQQQ
jgi:hypothetical protein